MIEALVKLLLILSENLGNLGWAILGFTIVLRLLLYPLNKSALKSAVKMRELQPKLQKIQQKYKGKPQDLQREQMKIYQEAGVNPVGGCMPQILQLAVFLVLYQALLSLLHRPELSNGQVMAYFYGWDLRVPDPTYILPVAAAASQFVASWLMMGKRSQGNQPAAAAKKSKNNKPADSAPDMASMMSSQMMYVMPVITGVFAAQFPAGLSLYWVVSTVFSIIQQWLVMDSRQREGALATVKFWSK